MCSLCFACLHSGLRFCWCNFCYRLFLCKWRECAGQSAGEKELSLTSTPAAILGSSNKTSTSVASCWCGSTSGYVSSPHEASQR